MKAEVISLGSLAWVALLPAVWMWQVIITNYTQPIRTMRLQERKGRKTIPTGCGVQAWAPEEKTVEITNIVELGE